jgi:hypothetical protein
MANKLNSLTIHKLTERTLIENLKPFLFFGGLFMALSLLVEIIFGPESNGLLANLIGYVIYAKLAVLVHRTVLLNEKGIVYAFKWGWPEIIYCLAIIAMMIVGMIGIALVTYLFLLIAPTGSVNGTGLTALSIVFFIGLFLLAGYYGARVALVFPSIAIGQSFTLPEIWNKTKPHTLTVFWLVIIFPILANVVPAAVFLLPFPEWLLGVLVLAMYAIIVIYCITLLSHCYHEIMGEPDQEQAPIQKALD